ncbi:MAG: hypothetical protein ABFD14_07260 [Anaerolineaceae bacterium]
MKSAISIILFIGVAILMSALGYSFWIIFGRCIEKLARSFLEFNAISLYTTLTTIGALIMLIVRKYQ